MKDNIEILDADQNMGPEYCFKLVMLGDSGVGKTSLVKYEINNQFIKNTDSTIIFEHSFKNFNILEKIVRLQIWDTCGQEIYRSLITNFYRNSSLAFIVFAIDE